MKKCNYFVTLAVLLAVSQFFACEGKECRDAPSNYSFEIPVSILPMQDTFKTGDTIRFSSVFDDNIYDRSSERTYRLENQLLYPRSYIVRIDTFPAQYAFDEIEWIVGEEYDYFPLLTSDMKKVYLGQYKYDSISRIYQMEISLIPKQTGIYFFSHTARITERSIQPDVEGLCGNSGVYFHSLLNNGETDGNIELLLESPDEFYNTYKYQRPDEFRDAAGYVFVVTE